MGVHRRLVAAVQRPTTTGGLITCAGLGGGVVFGPVIPGEARLITRLNAEFGLDRLWPWIEKTALRRVAFALIVGSEAAALHWLIFPITQARVTFISFLPAIVLVTTIAGRWP